MNILISGACGQLGRTLRDISRGYGHNCIFTDVVSGEDVLALDVTDASAVSAFVKDNAIDVIINCAGYTDVNRAETEVDKARLLNAYAPAVLAAAAKDAGAVLFHISTDYVFDGQAETPYREADPKGPLSVYAKTKLEGDEAVESSGCRYIILRTAWLYSRYGRNFFRTIEEKAASGAPLTVVADQIGSPTYAPDLAGAIFRIIDEGKMNMNGTYHYSDEGICSWYEFADAIVRGFGYDTEVKPCRTDDYPSKVRRPAYSLLDKSLFRETFGFEIPHWRDSLSACICEYLSCR